MIDDVFYYSNHGIALGCVVGIALLLNHINACVTGGLLFTDQGYAGGLLTGALKPAQYAPSQPAQ